MYIIKNISKQDLVLGDLRLSLRPGQQQDLDKISSRYVLEQSTSIKTGIKKRLIKVIRKDSSTSPPTSEAITTIVEKDSNEEVMKEIKALKKDLINRQQAIARQQQTAIESAGGGLGGDAMGQLNQAIAALQSVAQGGGGSVSEVKDDEFDLPDDKAVEVHKRTVNRLSKDTKGKITHSESRSNANVDSNIDELEDLLGQG